MKHLKHTTALLAAATVLIVAGCGGSGGSADGSTGVTPMPPTAPPPPAATMDFTMFTRDLMVPGKTNDLDDPMELEAIEWMFDENETAYDDIITASEL